MKQSIKENWEDIKEVISETTLIEFIVIIFLAIIMIIGAGLINDNNRITEGIVVDRQYSSGGSYYHSTENGGYYTHIEPSYRFCIEGEKNGERVRYWFEVTPGEYEKYRIGDNYP